MDAPLPKGFDQFRFGMFIRQRDQRPVEVYAWRDGTVSWITLDNLKTKSGICLMRSFMRHHRIDRDALQEG
jgi:hypothetical protein